MDRGVPPPKGNDAFHSVSDSTYISEHLSGSIYNFPLCFGRNYVFPPYFGNTFLFPLFLKFPPIFVPFMCFFIINVFLASPYFHHDAFYSSCNTRTGPSGRPWSWTFSRTEKAAAWAGLTDTLSLPLKSFYRPYAVFLNRFICHFKLNFYPQKGLCIFKKLMCAMFYNRILRL